MNYYWAAGWNSKGCNYIVPQIPSFIAQMKLKPVKDKSLKLGARLLSR